jgi:hypothetical protein
MNLFNPTGEIQAWKIWPPGVRSFGEHVDAMHTDDPMYPYIWQCDCPTTVESKWKGGRTVEFSGELVRHARRTPNSNLYAIGKDRVVFGDFRLLLLGIKLSNLAAGYDTYLAMEDGPLAVCAKMYREAVFSFLYRFCRAEAWWRSYGIPELKEGELMPVADWLGERLL